MSPLKGLYVILLTAALWKYRHWNDTLGPGPRLTSTDTLAVLVAGVIDPEGMREGTNTVHAGSITPNGLHDVAGGKN